MIVVHATSYIAPESRKVYLTLTRETIEASRREEGCIAYSCSEDIAEPGAFHWFEAWADVESFNAHVVSDHHRGYVARLTVSGEVRRTRTPEGHYLEATELSHDELLARGVDRAVLPISQDGDRHATLAALGFSAEEIQNAGRS